MKKALNKFYAVIAVGICLAPTTTAFGQDTTAKTAKSAGVNRSPAATQADDNSGAPPVEAPVNNAADVANNLKVSGGDTPAATEAPAAKPKRIRANAGLRKPASVEETNSGTALTKGYASEQLTLGELNMIKNLSVSKEGNDPDSTAAIYGMMPSACVGLLKVEHIITGAHIGFSVVDKSGAGRKCLEANKDKNCGQIACTALSSLPDFRMDLHDKGDGTVGLLHRDPNRDKDSDIWEDFSPAISHKSMATIRNERASAAKASNDELIRKLRSQLSCRATSEDDLIMKQNARDSLANLGALTSRMAENADRDVASQQFDMLARKINKLDPVKNPDEFAEAVEELKTFVAEHADDQKTKDFDPPRAAAALLSNKAAAIVKNPKAPLSTYNTALDLLDQASNLPGLSEKSQGEMQALVEKSKGEKFVRYVQDPKALADRGFQDDLKAYASDVQSTMQGCASVMDAGNDAACQEAQQSMMTLNQVQMVAQRTQYTAYMQQQQQMMNYYRFGSNMGGMYNMFQNPMMMGGYNPMMMGGYNPMMMGGYGGFSPMMSMGGGYAPGFNGMF